ILGGGFAGVYAAQELGRRLGRTRGRSVALISEENYMVFQPMLAEVAGASVSPRHVVNPLRLLCRHVTIFKGRVETVDWAARSVRFLAGPNAGAVTLGFRHLVVALGAVVDLSRIPGMAEHAFLMRNVGDAMLLRSTLLGRLEEANVATDPEVRQRLLTFVVVGGGYSGVETAGQILDMLHGILRYYPDLAVENPRVVLVHSGERLLPTLSPSLSEYTARLMRSRGLELHLARRVSAVSATRVVLDDGTALSTATVVSTIGNAPHPVVQKLINEASLPTERGRIITGPSLRVEGVRELWAAGDCAAVPHVDGGWCPQTAQFAYRQGRLLGRNLAAVLEGKPPRDFTFRGLGELATIGHRAAVAQILGLKFSGFIAWWMWRTIYLMKLPRIDRKLRVLIDWTLDLFFPRDINMLSPRYSQQVKEMHLEAGDVLFRAGEPAFSLYVVRSGRIDLSDEHGVVSSHRAGDYFGERALLSDRVWRFTATAAEPTALVAIPGSVFRQIVGSGGSLGRLFRKSATRYQSRSVIDAIAARLPAEILDAPISDLVSRDLVVFRRDQPIAEILPTLRARPHSSYPVVDADGRYRGLIRRDDLYDFLKQADARRESPIEAAGLTQVPTVPPTATVREVIERLIRSGSNKIAVFEPDSGRLCGLVTTMDLVSAATPANAGARPPGS
ncbi:MAG: CBS domain-containing protein, partial [Verrucomicrobia bacterium]